VIGIVLIVSAPLVLGAGGFVMLRALAGLDEHHCACGMKAGACGCPECERIEHARLSERDVLREHPVLKSSCGDDSVVPGAGWPLIAPPMCSATLPPLGFESALVDGWFEVDLSIARAKPPLPPPKYPAA